MNEADFLLDSDIKAAVANLNRNLPWWQGMKEDAQTALANMCFNMGWPRLSGFKKMIAALEVADYETAAAEALNSRWAGQVGSRADRIAKLFRR